MKTILNASNPLELNAIFIQPSRWCALNCPGCYVKEHTGNENGYHIDPLILADFYRITADRTTKLWANQITISIDDLPKDISKAKHMKHIFITSLTDKNFFEKYRSNWDIPELHMTFHTMRTFEKYCDETSTSMVYAANILNMFSVSNVDTTEDMEKLEFLKKVSKTHLNFNHLVPYNINSKNLRKYINKVQKVGEIVDSIYLVINKTPIGKTRNNLINIGDRNRMITDISYINSVKENVSPDVRRKIVVDGCLQDTINHMSTGYGCSSNVSRIQIWPDGSVTGCPYAFDSNNQRAETFEDLLDNIRAARKEYDFKEKCHLPEIYSTIR